MSLLRINNNWRAALIYGLLFLFFWSCGKKEEREPTLQQGGKTVDTTRITTSAQLKDTVFFHKNRWRIWASARSRRMILAEEKARLKAQKLLLKHLNASEIALKNFRVLEKKQSQEKGVWRVAILAEAAVDSANN